MINFEMQKLVLVMRNGFFLPYFYQILPQQIFLMATKTCQVKET